MSVATLAADEHTSTSVDGEPATTYELRVTTVFRREHGEWSVVHRHGDPLASSAAVDLVQRRVATGPTIT